MSRKQHPVRKAFNEATENIRHAVIGAGVFTVDRDVPEGELPHIVLHTEALHRLLGRVTEAHNRSMERSWENMHADLRRVLQAKPTDAEHKAAKRYNLHVDLMARFDEHLERFMKDETARNWLGLDGSMELRGWFFAQSLYHPRRFMRKQLEVKKVEHFTYTMFTSDIGIWANCAAQERDLAEIERSMINAFVPEPESHRDHVHVSHELTADGWVTKELDEECRPKVTYNKPEQSSRESEPTEWDRVLAGLLNKFGPEPAELLEDYLERVIWLYQAYADRWEEGEVATYNANHDALPRRSTVRVEVGK